MKGIELNVFNGYCRYGNFEYDELDRATTTNSITCYEKCKNNPQCSAFDYTYNAQSINCILYHGGPYSKGTGYLYSRCYIMKGGILMKINTT